MVVGEIIKSETFLTFVSFRTRSRSWRNIAVLSSKLPRHTTENITYFLIVSSTDVSKRSLPDTKVKKSFQVLD